MYFVVMFFSLVMVWFCCILLLSQYGFLIVKVLDITCNYHYLGAEMLSHIKRRNRLINYFGWIQYIGDDQPLTWDIHILSVHTKFIFFHHFWGPKFTPLILALSNRSCVMLKLMHIHFLISKRRDSRLKFLVMERNNGEVSEESATAPISQPTNFQYRE
jgi:hypothetical protein